MSHPVIIAEKLSKSYLLRHNRTRSSYIALRDVLTERARKIFMGRQKAPLSEEFFALLDVTFSINDGDRVGIIGRNGAGKSTLLKILSRITTPSTGQVTIEGRVASLLEVGTGFHPELTGRENVFLNGSILGMSRAEIRRKFDEIVAFAEVEKFLDTPVKRYSSGMYVRLAFAVAAHLEPEILVVDEVLAVGDAQFQRKCLGKMEDISRNQGRTVLFVSHALSMVSKLCNKGILLDRGKLIHEGAIQDVVRTYEDSLLNEREDTDLPPGVFYDQGVKNKDDYSVTKVSIFDNEMSPKNYISTYDEIIVEIEYFSPVDFENGSVSFFLKTLNDIAVLRFATQPDQTVHCRFRKGLNRIRCRIPKLNLPMGNYVFSAGLAVPMREWLYRNTEMFVFKIHERDIYNSGYSPILENALTITDYSWEIID